MPHDILYLVFVYSPNEFRSLAHVCTTDPHRAAWFALVMLERGCEIDLIVV